MQKLAHIYRLINVLSLDVVAGAMASALFFCKLFGVILLPAGVGALGLAVWILYTTDHLLDARGSQNPAASVRHRFHQEHFVVLSWLLVLAVAVSAVLIFFIRKPLLEAGALLAAAASVYIILQGSLKYVKEVSGGVLYCAGVLLPALSLSVHVVTVPQAMLIGQFLLIVLFNLFLFALFDRCRDIKDKHQSFVTLLGVERTRAVLFALFFLNVLLLAIQLWLSMNLLWPLLTVAVMNLAMFLLFIFQNRLNGNELYRPLGDAVFLLPLVFVLL